MGTASQTVRDPEDQQAFQKMLNEVRKSKKLTEAKKKSLQGAIARAIKDVINNDPDFADVVTLAVQQELKKEVIQKYKQWKDTGSKANKWPFK